MTPLALSCTRGGLDRHVARRRLDRDVASARGDLDLRRRPSRATTCSFPLLVDDLDLLGAAVSSNLTRWPLRETMKRQLLSVGSPSSRRRRRPCSTARRGCRAGAGRRARTRPAPRRRPRAEAEAPRPCRPSGWRGAPSRSAGRQVRVPHPDPAEPSGSSRSATMPTTMPFSCCT